MTTFRDFDFNFDSYQSSREDLLTEAMRVVAGLEVELGEQPPVPDPNDPKFRFLAELNQEIAKFGAYPEVHELKENHFTDYGLVVPTRYKDLSKQFKFFWTRFPIILSPLEDTPFSKLQCGIKFSNPQTTAGHLQPRTYIILPDRKFSPLLEVNGKVEVRIGGNFEFEAVTKDLTTEVNQTEVSASAGVGTKATGELGLGGSFTYQLEKAEVEHRGVGTERVFWTLKGVKFFQKNNPNFIVILQVPKLVKQVNAEAALQAYHRPDIWTSELAEVINYYFHKPLATFFKQGAPAWDVQNWNIISG